MHHSQHRIIDLWSHTSKTLIFILINYWCMYLICLIVRHGLCTVSVADWPSSSPCTRNSAGNSSSEQKTTVSDADRATADQRHAFHREKSHYREWLAKILTLLCRLFNPPLANTGTLCDADVLFVCLFICLSPMKFVKLFTRWQHLAVSGGLSYWLRYISSIGVTRCETCCECCVFSS